MATGGSNGAALDKPPKKRKQEQQDGGDARPSDQQQEQQPAAAQAADDERDNPAAAAAAAVSRDGVERQSAAVSGIMSSQRFDQLELTEQTQKAIAELDFSHMTEVQARTIPPLLLGRDLLGAAKTGGCQHVKCCCQVGGAACRV